MYKLKTVSVSRTILMYTSSNAMDYKQVIELRCVLLSAFCSFTCSLEN